MENYVLIFKTSISTTLDRSHIIEKLYQGSHEIQLATIDIEDEEKILRIESSKREIAHIVKLIRLEGHEVSLLATFEKDIYIPVLETGH